MQQTESKINNIKNLLAKERLGNQSSHLALKSYLRQFFLTEKDQTKRRKKTGIPRKEELMKIIVKKRKIMIKSGIMRD